MAPKLIFPEEELALTTPRQLVPTVGPMIKGVEIIGTARRGMENFLPSVGPSSVCTQKPSSTNFGWKSEAYSLEVRIRHHPQG